MQEVLYDFGHKIIGRNYFHGTLYGNDGQAKS